MTPHIRLARPVRSLSRAESMYRHGLGMTVLGRFEDHAGYDGVMLGYPGESYHLEFTVCHPHPVEPAPTPEDLLVLYLPEAGERGQRCDALLAAGFVETDADNPYWREHARSFIDPDGYRVLVAALAWSNTGD